MAPKDDLTLRGCGGIVPKLSLLGEVSVCVGPL